jgi:cryptochrome
VEILKMMEGKEKPLLPSIYPRSPSDPLFKSPSQSKKGPSARRNPYSTEHCYFVGGETEAHWRLGQFMADASQVLAFQKPKTAPNDMTPSTTTLSPYLKFGCISPRHVWHAIQNIINANKRTPVSQPPESLHGQLYWREYFYLSSVCIPNFHKMEGNPLCKQIDFVYPQPNSEAASNLAAWKDGRTGYPWIDACMIQLREHGWMHHLGRHAVACFLTRGDLYIHWEEGRDVFDELLLDADYALNNANWMWLSASGFFHQYFRVYSPVAFGQKTDKNGNFVRHFVPALKKFPAKYIYEPWKAPIEVQKAAGCIIGEDYPLPIVDHDVVRPINLEKMKAAYAGAAVITKRPRAADEKQPAAKRQKKE